MNARQRLRLGAVVLLLLVIVAVVIGIVNGPDYFRCRRQRRICENVQSHSGVVLVNKNSGSMPRWVRDADELAIDDVMYGVFFPGPEYGETYREITDDEVIEIVPFLAEVEGLSEIGISSRGVSDRGLAKLVELKDLWRVGLYRTQVSDEGLRRLKELPNLGLLMIGDCPQITADGVGALRQSLPDLQVFWDDDVLPPVGAGVAAP
jgi:hypothetical protein